MSSLLQLADKDEYGTLFKVVVFTGIRESEAIGLTWDVIDFTAGTILICKQLQKRPKADGGFVFASLKNDRSRLLTPAPFVMDLLRAHKKQQALQRLQAGDLWQGWQNEKKRESALVFTNVLGDHLSPQTVYNHFKKLGVFIGAPDACVHDLRHTYATLSLQNGDDVKTVQEALGHATASFTLDIYGHVSERMKKDSASRMQKYIDNFANIK